MVVDEVELPSPMPPMHHNQTPPRSGEDNGHRGGLMKNENESSMDNKRTSKTIEAPYEASLSTIFPELWQVL